MTDPTAYCRPRIPEMLADIPYDPFKLDVWQLGSDFNSAFDVSRLILSFTHFHRDFVLQFVIPEVKTVIEAMASNDASLRLTAIEGLSRLGAVVHSLTPQSLHIAPMKIEV